MFLIQTLLSLLFYLSPVNGRLTMNGTHEKALRGELFNPSHYDKQMRPVITNSLPINITFKLQLSKLVDLVGNLGATDGSKLSIKNTKSQVLQTDVWITQKWVNPFLTWNKSDYAGIHSLHIMPADMWVPDTVLYNSGEGIVLSGSVEKFKTNIVLNSDGACTWMSPATFKSSCELDVTFFPFDSQVCKMTFGSWTYDNRLLRLDLMNTGHTNAEKYTVNGDWRIEQIATKRLDTKYSCCPDSYSDITYTFVLERRPLYHVIYVVLPCVVIAALTLVCFYVPADCGERIGLCITVLLAMSVYLLIVAQMLPENSNKIPLLGVYYMATMCQVAGAIVATAVVLRCHFSRSKPPDILVRFAHFRFTSSCKRRNNNAEFSKTNNAEFPKQGRVSPEIELSEAESVRKNNDTWRVTEEDAQEQWSKEWLLIGKRFDNAFFIGFLLMFFITPLAIFLQKAPRAIIDD